MELLPKREHGRELMNFVVCHLKDFALNHIPTKYHVVFYENTSEDIIEF